MFRLLLPMALGCNGGKLSSDEEAELAYLGLDGAVERGLKLGLQGFNQASSANIADQSEDGDESGTMTISGQVDQGSSDNKGLRLFMELDEYADEVDVDREGEEDDDIAITYDTRDSDLPALDISMRDIPSGTLEGALVGTFEMTGDDLEGDVTLNVQMVGAIVPDPDNSENVVREEGTTRITGTATNEDDGEYEIDVTR